MRAGTLRHRVELLEPQDGPSDGQGGTQPAAPLVVSRPWVAITPVSGREAVVASQVDPRVTHHVRMRYRPGVTARHQLRVAGHVWAIQSVVDVDARHRELILACVEAV